jgi:hypothetical protein
MPVPTTKERFQLKRVKGRKNRNEKIGEELRSTQLGKKSGQTFWFFSLSKAISF